MELDQTKIQDFLLTKSCDLVEFRMNVPHASHMGGVWERQIRTVRSVLAGLLEDLGNQLDDEALRTLFTEAENVVNCCPLTADLSSPDSPNLITRPGDADSDNIKKSKQRGRCTSELPAARAQVPNRKAAGSSG